MQKLSCINLDIKKRYIIYHIQKTKKKTDGGRQQVAHTSKMWFAKITFENQFVSTSCEFYTKNCMNQLATLHFQSTAKVLVPLICNSHHF